MSILPPSLPPHPAPQLAQRATHAPRPRARPLTPALGPNASRTPPTEGLAENFLSGPGIAAQTQHALPPCLAGLAGAHAHVAAALEVLDQRAEPRGQRRREERARAALAFVCAESAQGRAECGRGARGAGEVVVAFAARRGARGGGEVGGGRGGFAGEDGGGGVAVDGGFGGGVPGVLDEGVEGFGGVCCAGWGGGGWGCDFDGGC